MTMTAGRARRHCPSREPVPTARRLPARRYPLLRAFKQRLYAPDRVSSCVEVCGVAGQVIENVGDHLISGERRPPGANVPRIRGGRDVEEPGVLILPRDDESLAILAFP
jgi:hypothetical protein